MRAAARGTYAGRMAGNQEAGDREAGEPRPYEPKYPGNLWRAGVATCAVLYTLVIITVIHAMTRQTPASAAMSAVALVIGAALLFSIGVLTRYSRVSQARAEHLQAQLQAAQDAQARAVILTERTRLAREVHDILAHSLSGLVLTLATAELLGRRGEASPENQAKILEQVARAQRIARDGLTDTRRAVAALRGDELPGPALLGRLVRDTSETAGIRACLTVSGTPRPLPPEAGLALYRTAQEALVNSAKYAGRGASAQLRLDYGAEWVTLEAEDRRPTDLVSPDPESPLAESPLPASPLAVAAPAYGLTFGGYGLTGMRERAELLGGDLTAGPTEAGFRVALRLPTRERADCPGAARRPAAARVPDLLFPAGSA
jgi:signal transduction histidine kinase